jgi:sugar phosphate isomerase/epimerase
MQHQNFRLLDQEVVQRFIDARRDWAGEPERLKLSWSNWGFGTEALEDSADRLQRNGIEWIELHGNLYGPDLGYRAPDVLATLDARAIKVGGICGMVMPEQELASNSPAVRQRFVDYLRRQLEFCVAVGGRYILFGAAAVGRPVAYDDAEVDRAAETLALVADDFADAGVLAAIEPIRVEETSIIHTCAEAAELIERVGHPGVQHIAGDVYHMLSGDGHVGRALLEYAPRMANLHLADSNRRALGTGQLDIDVVIMALYASGFHTGERFCTAEPLGGGANPYDAMYGRPDVPLLDALVATTAETWRAREEAVLAASDADLLAVTGAAVRA